VCDGDGTVVEGLGTWRAPVFVRSSVKCLQALPLLESGAAERFGITDAELALALASHSGEESHTRVVRGLLERLGLAAADLRCGAHEPWDNRARQALRDSGAEPSALHHNCSGKHAGFLALALHLRADPARYLEPDGPVQQLVRAAVVDLTGVAERDLYVGVDGCSAPTFRVPLSALATAFARVANPAGLPAPRRAACERLLGAVARHPDLIAGSRGRFCSDVARASGGRLFPKVGGEAVYAIGVRGAGRALAVKIDDGNQRGMHPVVVELLRRFGFASAPELEALARWEEKRLVNFAGLDVGRTEVAF
jgi:L-asparaginase II